MKEAGYEVREFPAQFWVSTDGVIPEDDDDSAFYRLFDYISGENAEGVVREHSRNLSIFI